MIAPGGGSLRSGRASRCGPANKAIRIDDGIRDNFPTEAARLFNNPNVSTAVTRTRTLGSWAVLASALTV